MLKDGDISYIKKIMENNDNSLPVGSIRENVPSLLQTKSLIFIQDREQKALFYELFDKNYPIIYKAIDGTGITRDIYNFAMERDADFVKCIQEIHRRHTEEVEGKVHEFSKNKGGFMDRMAWLRFQETGSWNPNSTVTMKLEQITVDQAKNRLEKLGNVIDAELIQGVPREQLSLVKSVKKELQSSGDNNKPVDSNQTK